MVQPPTIADVLFTVFAVSIIISIVFAITRR